ncbi:MAG: hypothetical protein KO206_00710 [Methanomicrobiaceae archaeon]|nr:hypothetical protein [Methanomicrobiaceae archaeon]MDD5418492.1 CAP domain-containing protein [Methanomicrobiaceae archaeon]
MMAMGRITSPILKLSAILLISLAICCSAGCVAFEEATSTATPASTPTAMHTIASTPTQKVAATKTPAPASTPSGINSVSTAAIEQAVFALTNEERADAGTPALLWDERLAAIAREHSRDMAENDFFSHDNLRGEDPTARAERHGYPTRKDLGGGWYTDGIAENIGKMPTGNVIGIGHVARDADAIARALVDSWMESPGHRGNMLEAGYDRLGVGVAYDGKYYVATQNFW